MNKEMEKIDEIIKEALTQEEAKFYNELDEQNLFQMLGGLFSGKLKWLILLINIIILIFFVVFVYCVVQFINVNETDDLIKWTVYGSYSMFIVASLKMFLFMQMDKNSIKRELKRIELQISILSSKIDK